MPSAKNPKNELSRIKELESLDILDTEPEDDYDEIVELASYICETPISLISLVDSDRQWFKAKKGIDANETSRDLAFCAHAILEPDRPLIVKDATKDKRFDDNDLVIKDPKIRFYAGIPLNTKSGHALGTLCVIDSKSHNIKRDQIRALEILSKSVVNLLELRRERDKEHRDSINKSMFIANLSHEIRTPLNAVIGMTELLLYSDINRAQQGQLKTVLYSGETLLHLINDILDFSKIESGKMELENVEFDLLSLVENVSDVLSIKTHAKGVDLIVNYGPDVPVNVIGDPTRIKQILFNIIGNAIKFTEEGSVELNIDAKKLDGSDYEFEIKIVDTGIGIAENRLNSIFEEFSQAELSTTRQFGGTGLGLSICKSLIELMSGDIKVESKIGEGSCFIIKFNMSVKKENSLVSSVNKLNGLKVLVVDDSKAICSHATEVLQNLDANVVAVSSAKEAITKLGNAIGDDAYDAVIVDYVMPDIDGIEFSKIIKKMPNLENTPLVLMTSYRKKGLDEELKGLGFVGYLTKPIHVNAISSMLSSINDNNEQKDIDYKKASDFLKGGLAKFNDTSVLIAEDNRTNLEIAKQMFSNLGCKVKAVVNGEESIDILQKEKFDIIFMDCNMPKMDGYEASRRIKKMMKGNEIAVCPIIAFTANSNESDKDKCSSAGMDDFLTKPVHIKDIKEILAKWLI